MKITLKDLFSWKELRLIASLKHAKAICEQVVQPNIERINKVVGQENDPMHIAYMCKNAIAASVNIEGIEGIEVKLSDVQKKKIEECVCVGCSPIVMAQLTKPVKHVKPWDGEGLPPVGARCLFTHGAVGSKRELVDGCKITIISEITRPNGNKGVVFVTDCDTDFVIDYSCCPASFKPIPAAHDIAVNELANLMKNNLTSDQVDGSYVICAELLVNAGYRKHASLNRDFSTGYTYKNECQGNWTAGIHIHGHGNAIEVYADTQQSAELLRDEILERISC